jgi:hypothetical protein
MPSELYTHLEQLDGSDPVQSATYREQAQDILANPNIALKIRTAIADLLMQANQQLTLKTVGGEDSY